MKSHRLFLLALLAVLAGCPTSNIDSAVSQANQKLELNGSPFRYKALDSEHMGLTLLPLPAGPTKAVPALKQKCMDSIASAEFKKGRSVANLEEVRHLKDGREVWILNTLGEGVAYVVAFENPSSGDSNVRMEGPTSYSK